MITSYEIWMEGYRATGNSSGASFVGSAQGKTFKDACIAWYASPRASEPQFFNAKSLSYWGCRLYDNASDAHSAFG